MKIKQLLARYHLKTRQSIYNWCEALNISLAKDNNGHVYATPEQIEQLDRLSEHLKKSGNTMASFTPITPVEIAQLDASADRIIDSSIDGVIDTLADSQWTGELVKAIASLRPHNPLWYLKELDQARASSWLLTTAEVQQLIGVKPVTRKKDRAYRRGSWTFLKSGKIGRQTAWRVLNNSELRNRSNGRLEELVADVEFNEQPPETIK
ncbi:MAG: hypothetical protein KME17_08035 [Cyanosarcina radialis HA8281-LM2]|jgi:hypothetical protein|nr:hypothetical protein [Cyanosarcina radialis HA8281-LM2]